MAERHIVKELHVGLGRNMIASMLCAQDQLHSLGLGDRLPSPSLSLH
jgi:hypothetical protein